MIASMIMKQLKITRGGQISVPAEVRHRWGTSRLVLDDRGDHLVLSPAPDDPIGALRGALADVKATSDDVRRAARADEAFSESRRG